MKERVLAKHMINRRTLVTSRTPKRMSKNRRKANHPQRGESYAYPYKKEENNLRPG